MRKVKIELPGGQVLYLGLPDGAKCVPENQQPSPPPSTSSGKETIQKTLYNELKEYCNGDKMEMEKVMRSISEWKNRSKTVNDIPSLSDGRAGAALRNLRDLKNNPKPTNTDNAVDPFGDETDDFSF